MQTCLWCGSYNEQGGHECIRPYTKQHYIPEPVRVEPVEPLPEEHGPWIQPSLEWRRANGAWRAEHGGLHLEVSASYVWKWRVLSVPEGRKPWHIRHVKTVAERALDDEQPGLYLAQWRCEQAAKAYLGEK